MTTKQYNLYQLRHDLIDQEMRLPIEDEALKIVEHWFEGRDSEMVAVKKLTKLGIIKEEK